MDDEGFDASCDLFHENQEDLALLENYIDSYFERFQAREQRKQVKLFRSLQKQINRWEETRVYQDFKENSVISPSISGLTLGEKIRTYRYYLYILKSEKEEVEYDNLQDSLLSRFDKR